MERPIVSNEARTHAFFDRPAAELVADMAEQVYERTEEGEVTYKPGHAKTILVDTPQGTKEYRVTVAEAYSASKPNRVWKGVRAEEIASLEPGMVVAYRYRAGILPFEVAHGADNVLIREMVDEVSGEKIVNPKAVAGVLGLAHGDRGRLTFFGENQFRFENINNTAR